MAIKTLVRKSGCFLYFMILLFIIGHIFPPPENYINYNIAKKLALFISGDENAEAMYDAYSYIDWLVMIFSIMPFYVLTMKLVRKTRSK